MSFIMAALALGGCAVAGIGIYTGLSFLKDCGKAVDDFFEETSEKEKRYRVYKKINEEESVENFYTSTVVDEALDNENEDERISDSDFEVIKEVYENIDVNENEEIYKKQTEEAAYRILKEGTTFGMLNPIKIIYLSTVYAWKEGSRRAEMEMEEKELRGC